ncbi:MAG TPA: host attachment protein [Kofleriaceae bacterium]|nr:host attachment protein [Kofleriaceae bacterium]
MVKRALIAIVDAAHARLYTYTQEGDAEPQFTELRDLVNPGRQAHGMFTDKPPRSPGDNHGTKDDHRGDHIAELDARFSKDVISQVEALVREYELPQVILVAGPKSLGVLRGEAARLEKRGIRVDEIAQNLAWLSAPQIHDQLAALNVIGPRMRAAVGRSARTR